MKKAAVLFFILAMGTNVVASPEDGSKDGLIMKVDFQFKNSKKSFQVKSDLKLSKQNNDWTPLTPPASGVALLGKLHEPKGGVFTMEYMIVDTSTTPVMVYQMGVASQVGKSSQVKSQGEWEGMTVSLRTEEVAL